MAHSRFTDTLLGRNKNLFSRIGIPKAARIPLLVALAVVVMVLGALLVRDKWLNDRIDAAVKKNDCSQGLKNLEKASSRAMLSTTKKKLVEYKLKCSYELHRYDEAITHAENLLKLYTDKNDNSKIRELKGLLGSINEAKATNEIDRQNDERIKRDLMDGKKDNYNGSYL